MMFDHVRSGDDVHSRVKRRGVSRERGLVVSNPETQGPDWLEVGW